jgi:L,D-transpeptidase-like protein
MRPTSRPDRPAPGGLGLLWAAPALLLFLLAACGRSPLDRLEAARKAMALAGEAGGVTRAPELCGAAQAAMVRAEAEVRVQQKRFSLARDFGEADRLVAQAHLAAERCAARARAARDRARERASRELDDLQAWVARVTSLARHAPGSARIREELRQAEIGLGEGRASFARDQFERASDAAERGRAAVTMAVDDLDRFFSEFLASPRRDLWRRWVSETLRRSRRDGAAVILIDKLRRQLLLMRGDEEIASYPVDLGTGGMDSKTHAGDAATPEGRYRVTEVRGPGQTHYYRALLIDYPNAEDRARYRKLVRAGDVSRRQGIGSLIEIHGQGGRDQDWTEGCVALENTDMDELTKIARVGTQVTIVGTIPDGAIP